MTDPTPPADDLALDPDQPYPWEQPHAAPEDRAVGLELELIELVHERGSDLAPQDAATREVDEEIEDVLEELADVAAELPQQI